eukprot:scaffold45858_cov63-Phaeocystis_antarctica.AAC.1
MPKNWRRSSPACAAFDMPPRLHLPCLHRAADHWRTSCCTLGSSAMVRGATTSADAGMPHSSSTNEASFVTTSTSVRCCRMYGSAARRDAEKHHLSRPHEPLLKLPGLAKCHMVAMAILRVDTAVGFAAEGCSSIATRAGAATRCAGFRRSLGGLKTERNGRQTNETNERTDRLACCRLRGSALVTRGTRDEAHALSRPRCDRVLPLLAAVRSAHWRRLAQAPEAVAELEHPRHWLGHGWASSGTASSWAPSCTLTRQTAL